MNGFQDFAIRHLRIFNIDVDAFLHVDFESAYFSHNQRLGDAGSPLHSVLFLHSLLLIKYQLIFLSLTFRK